MNAISKIKPWVAKALPPNAKERHFREGLELAQERQEIRRGVMVGAYTVGGVGVLCMVGAVATVLAVLPLKTTEVRFFVADQTTGIISQPISLADTPKSFNEAVDRQYLRRYIDAREGWVYDMDRQNDHQVKIMSSPDEQARYQNRRNSPVYPGKLLGKDGHIEVANFRYHRSQNGKNATRSYQVQYDAITWRGASRESVKSFTAVVDFQWHPEMSIGAQDVDLNPGGMVVIAYSSNPDQIDGKQ